MVWLSQSRAQLPTSCGEIEAVQLMTSMQVGEQIWEMAQCCSWIMAFIQFITAQQVTLERYLKNAYQIPGRR